MHGDIEQGITKQYQQRVKAEVRGATPLNLYGACRVVKWPQVFHVE
jgi:hypothetical protein